MHTREQTLQRLDEIVQFAMTIPAENISLDQWVSDTGAENKVTPECGAICCIIGWMAALNKFGFYFFQGEAGRPCVMSKTGNPVFSYGAASKVLFGVSYLGSIPDEEYVQMLNVVSKLFNPAGAEESATGLSDKDIFLLRVNNAKDNINHLYDYLEAAQQTA